MINLVIPSLIMSAISLAVAVAALAMIIGMKLSTHKIEWKPLKIDDPLLESDKEYKEEQEDEAKVLEDALNLQRKKQKKPEDPMEEVFQTANF
jgi:hypothetical protein